MRSRTVVSNYQICDFIAFFFSSMWSALDFIAFFVSSIMWSALDFIAFRQLLSYSYVLKNSTNRVECILRISTTFVFEIMKLLLCAVMKLANR
mgnify:CR=1 FL=1